MTDRWKVATGVGEPDTALAMPPPCNADDTLPPATSQPAASELPYHRATSCRTRGPLQLAVPADPVTPSVVRQRVREWLAAWSWPRDLLDDIVLAVSEAVSNAVEHAYLGQSPGMVEVCGGIEMTSDCWHHVMIIVRDHGRWRSPPSHHENRRRGIPLMRAYMESVTIGHPPMIASAPGWCCAAKLYRSDLMYWATQVTTRPARTANGLGQPDCPLCCLRRSVVAGQRTRTCA